jgi:hypothetical protein
MAKVRSKAVAKHAGVSIATVSRVVNHTYFVSAEMLIILGLPLAACDETSAAVPLRLLRRIHQRPLSYCATNLMIKS